VLNRLTKLAGGLVLAGTLATLVWGQAAPAWKDQGESDLGLAAQAATDPAKKLDLIKKWEQQYPDSALKDQRTLMKATSLLAAIGPLYGKTDAASLDIGEKDAKDLEDHFSDYFADSVKPAQITADQWATAKKSSAIQLHMYLAFDDGVKKDDAGAEVELKKALQTDPNQALASYQLGSTVIREMSGKTVDPAKYSEALYDFARAVSVTGPGALPAATKTQADAALKKYYSNYHGSADGLDKLEQQTASAALPPDGFHVESIVDIQAAKDKDHAAWAAAHPDLDFWENIKTALTTQGDAYFANLKDVGFPPTPGDTYKGPAMFSAKVVSQPTPKEILVSVDNVPTGDAILKFDDNIKGDIPAGTDVQFKGVVDAYTKDPGYVLTLNIQDPKTDITGLPADVKFVPDTAAKPAAGRGTKAGTKAPVKKAQ
jgi:hypothetical protein